MPVRACCIHRSFKQPDAAGPTLLISGKRALTSACNKACSASSLYELAYNSAKVLNACASCASEGAQYSKDLCSIFRKNLGRRHVLYDELPVTSFGRLIVLQIAVTPRPAYWCPADLLFTGPMEETRNRLCNRNCCSSLAGVVGGSGQVPKGHVKREEGRLLHGGLASQRSFVPLSAPGNL